jgi:hypothetical protein
MISTFKCVSAGLILRGEVPSCARKRVLWLTRFEQYNHRPGGNADQHKRSNGWNSRVFVKPLLNLCKFSL